MNKKGSLTGLGKVYGFTLIQLLKNKSNLISFGIIIIAAIAAVPVMSVFMGGGSAETAVFYTDVTTVEAFLGEDEVVFDARYFIQYAYSIVVMMICIFACTYIVRSIIEEKSSKLVETLLVSIRSEAMILGKIMAIITFIFFMFLLIAAGFGLSYLVTGMFTDTSFINEKLASVGFDSGIMNIGPDFAVVVVISLLLACIALSQIAALSGAGCSSMEDMESANMAATMIILVCYMVTVFITPLGSGAAVFMSLCPFLSSFAAPAYYAAGDIGMTIMIISWVIQIAVIAVIHKISGKVYDSLIMYKGSRLKMARILSMAMGRKGENDK